MSQHLERLTDVGGVEEISIQDLAARVLALTGSDSPIVRIPYDQAYETGFEDMQRRRPDTTRIRELLGWEPTRGLDDIIRDVAVDVGSRLPA